MPDMTSRERVLKLFAREPIDTMPCFSGQGMVTLPAIDTLGIRFPQVHLTAENMAAEYRGQYRFPEDPAPGMILFIDTATRQVRKALESAPRAAALAVR